MTTKNKNPKSVPFMIRQGDVLLVAEDEIPSTATEVPPDVRGVVLAEGEVTGHAHRIPARYAGNAAKYRDEGDAQYLRVTAPVPFRHEEHKTACSLCPEPPPLATHRRVDGFSAADYFCAEHAADRGPVAEIAEPGATELPARTYRVTLHGEYQPGALPRNVAD